MSVDHIIQHKLADADTARRSGAISAAIQIATEALTAAEQASRFELVARVQLDLGNLHRYVPNALESFRLLHAAETYFRNHNNPLISMALARQGMTLGDMGDYNRALDLYREALNIIEREASTRDVTLEATCFGAIGVACTQLVDFEQAESAYKKALQLYDSVNNHESACFVYNNLSILRIRTIERLAADAPSREQLANEAFTFIADGLARNQQYLNSIMLEGALHNSRGDLLAALGCHAESLDELATALAAYQKMNLPRGIVDVLTNMGEAHKDFGSLDDALTCLLEADSIINAHQLNGHARKLNQLMADIYEAKGNFTEALRCFKHFHQLESESQRLDTQRKLQQLALRAEIESALAEAKQQREKSVDLTIKNQALDKIAHEDALTGVANRRRLDMWVSDQPSSIPTGMAVALLDIDHFKKINDGYSHAIGDAVLRELGKLLVTLARKEDLVARYGGEEFVMVLHNVEKANIAERMEQVRRAVEVFAWGQVVAGLHVTTSIGVAAADGTTAFGVLLERADASLYAAKAAGRNRVVAVDESMPT
jgi:diguanylate cyclase (GGDEF)-like protein